MILTKPLSSLRLIMARLLSREVMGFLAIAALGMALQALLFGVPEPLHPFLRASQIAVFALFGAEYLGGLIQARDRLNFIRRPSRVFDLLILLAAMASFLPSVEDMLLHAQAFQILRLGPIIFFGYVGTKDIALQLFAEETEPLVPVPEFFRLVEEGRSFRSEPVGEQELLAWAHAPERAGFYVCRGKLTAELSRKLAADAVPASMLENALSESGFPRFLGLGGMHVFAAAMPFVHPEAPSVHRVTRSPFVVVLTEQSVLLLNSHGPEIPQEVRGLIAGERLFSDQPLPLRFTAGIFKLLLERYEAAASQIEEEIRSEELQPLDRTGGGIYREIYFLRRTLSGLKSDLWRLKHIFHSFADGRRHLPFPHAHLEDFFALISHSADFCYDTFEQLEGKASAVLDLRINLVSFEMNKFMGLIAVVTAVGLIPTAMSGLLGMNILGVNFPVTLGNVVFLCTLLIVLTLYVMRLNGWLKFR